MIDVEKSITFIIFSLLIRRIFESFNRILIQLYRILYDELLKKASVIFNF